MRYAASQNGFITQSKARNKETKATVKPRSLAVGSSDHHAIRSPHYIAAQLAQLACFYSNKTINDALVALI